MNGRVMVAFADDSQRLQLLLCVFPPVSANSLAQHGMHALQLSCGGSGLLLRLGWIGVWVLRNLAVDL